METRTETVDRTAAALPLILVSAYDLPSASMLIANLTNKKVEDDLADNKQELKDSVWHITNKYYRVDVELYPTADSDSLPPSLAERLEAHIIYITDDEDDEAAAERAEERWSKAASVGVEGVCVQLLVTAGATTPPALLSWARRRRYEPVPLKEVAEDDTEDSDSPFKETYGIERARAALHAHTWSGLERLDPSRNFVPIEANGVNSSDEDYEGVDDDEGDAEDVERAEAFAEALGMLGEAGQEARRLPDGERRMRAERLVAAFCRAMGADLHTL